MNIADIAILLIVALVVVWAIRRITKNKGRCSCGCGSCGQPCVKRKDHGSGT